MVITTCPPRRTTCSRARRRVSSSSLMTSSSRSRGFGPACPQVLPFRQHQGQQGRPLFALRGTVAHIQTGAHQPEVVPMRPEVGEGPLAVGASHLRQTLPVACGVEARDVGPVGQAERFDRFPGEVLVHLLECVDERPPASPPFASHTASPVSASIFSQGPNWASSPPPRVVRSKRVPLGQRLLVLPAALPEYAGSRRDARVSRYSRRLRGLPLMSRRSSGTNVRTGRASRQREQSARGSAVRRQAAIAVARVRCGSGDRGALLLEFHLHPQVVLAAADEIAHGAGA